MREALVRWPVLLGTLLLVCCSPAESRAPAPTQVASATGERLADRQALRVAGMPSATIDLVDFAFQPALLQGTPGQRLALTLRNTSQTPHTFTLAAGGLDREVPPGGEVQVEVTFPTSGTLMFACRFHQARGMSGALLAGDAALDITPAPTAPRGYGGYSY